MNGYAASVDWPAAAFWHELADSFPDAIVLLSTRSSAEVWWKSANETIFDINRTLSQDPALVDFVAFPRALLAKTFTPNWTDEREAKQVYDVHNARVRASVPPPRLVDWQPGRWVGANLSCSRPPDSGRSVPARQHDRPLPPHDRSRRLEQHAPELPPCAR